MLALGWQCNSAAHLLASKRRPAGKQHCEGGKPESTGAGDLMDPAAVKQLHRLEGGGGGGSGYLRRRRRCPAAWWPSRQPAALRTPPGAPPSLACGKPGWAGLRA